MRFAVYLGDFCWRPLTPCGADTDFVVALRNADRAQHAFFSGRISREDHIRFLGRAEECGEINWIIERADEAVATAGIYDIDWKNGRAEAGRITSRVPEAFAPNNIVTCIVAFEYLGLNKLVGLVAANNQVVCRAGQRFGAVLEGTLRQHVRKDGAPVDVQVYGTLRSDWRKLRPALVSQFGEPRVVRLPDGEA